MNELSDTPKKRFIYKPETTGRFKRGPLDWSLDQLIEYRQSGVSPARIPDKDLLFKLGSYGVTMEATADIFGISIEKFTSNLDWYDNWKAGKTSCGVRVRAKLVAQALEENSTTALIYLDKIFGGDVSNVNININNNTLGAVKTQDLLEVMFTDIKNDSN